MKVQTGKRSIDQKKGGKRSWTKRSFDQQKKKTGKRSIEKRRVVEREKRRWK